MQSVDPETRAQATTPSLGDVAHDTSEYVQAWTSLVASETRLARASVARLAISALLIPALALAITLCADALIAAILHRWLHDWSICLGIVLLLNLCGLFGLLVAMRRWWHNLSLPRSRGALSQLIERMS
ncbi:MAG: hypothetical protein ABI304_02730 [Rudaea sp.]